MTCRDIKNNNFVPEARGTFINVDWVNTLFPYYDGRKKTYNVAVDVGIAGKVGDLEPVFQKAKQVGIPKLFLYYNKKQTQETIDLGIAFAQTPDYLVQDRPNPSSCPTFGIKVLVVIPKENFDRVPFVDPKEPKKANVELFIQTNETEKDFPLLADKVQGFSNNVTSFAGKVAGMNFESEGKNIRGFHRELKKHFQINGYELLPFRNDLIIIGLNEQKEVEYVMLDRGHDVINLSIKIELFKQSKYCNKRTLFFVENRKNILKTTGNWLDMVKKFGDGADFSFLEKQGNSLEKFLNDVNKTSIKTDIEKEREEELLTPEFKETIYETTKLSSAFVGDELLGNPEQVFDQMESIDDVFGGFLNKIGMKQVVATAIKCLISQLPLDEIRRILRLLALLAMPCEAFIQLVEKTGFSFTKIPLVRDALKQSVLSCIDNLNLKEKKRFFRNLSSDTGIKVSTNIDLDKIDSDHLIGALGEVGNNIIFTICDKNKEKILDFLTSIDITLDIEIPDINFDIEFPDFEIPTLSLPDFLPTIDILSSLGEQLERAIIEALTTALVETIKQILLDIVKNCANLSKGKIGSIDIAKIYANKLGALPEVEKLISSTKSLLRNIDEIADTLENSAELLINFINDLSAVLTPLEVSLLLDGTPNRETSVMMSCLVENKYAGLTPLIKKNKMNDIFIDIGKLVGRDELVEQLKDDKFGVPFCNDVDDTARRKLLENKGLSKKQIDDELNKDRVRKLNRLKELGKMLDTDKVLNGVLDPSLCSGNLMKGVHPSFSNLLEKTTNTIFDGIRMSFEQDVVGFVPAISETKNTLSVPRVIPRKITARTQEGDEVEIRNPEYARLLAQGVIVEDPEDDDGEPVRIQQEETFSSNQKIVAKALRTALSSFESDQKYFEVSQNKITLKLPTLNPNFPIPTTNLTELARSIQSLNVAHYEIEYELLNEINKDAFILRIFSVDKNHSKVLRYETRSNEDIPEVIKNGIKTLNLSPSNTFPVQAGLFAELITKVLSNGGRIIENNSSVQLPSYASGILTERNREQIRDYSQRVANEMFVQGNKDLISSIALFASKSPLFNKDVLGLINFIPNNKNCDLSLLGFDDLKSQTKDNVKCLSAPSLTGDEPKLGELEKQSINGVLSLLFRTYLTELLLRSLPIIGEFKFDKENDNVFINYFIDRFQKELDQEYRQDVIDYTSEILQVPDETALSAKAKQDYDFETKRMANVVGTSGQGDLKQTIIKDLLPLTDVGASLNRLSDPSLSITSYVGGQTNKNVMFDISNGNFILEKYVRVKTKPTANFPRNSLLGSRQTIDGVYSFQELYGLISTLNSTFNGPDFVGSSPPINLNEFFEKLGFGLRLIYIPPIDLVNGLDRDLERVFALSSQKIISNSISNKSLRQDETFKVNGNEVIATTYPIPVLSVEQVLDNVEQGTDLEQVWKNVSGDLIKNLVEAEETKILFDFIFSSKRAVSLLMLYCILFFDDNELVKHLFDATKHNIKSTFYACINAGSWKYENKDLKDLGGVAGLMNQAQNNQSPSAGGSPLGMAIQMALTTPIKILKGIVETTDGNLSIASKICDIAKINNINLPIELVSLSLLPSNIIPFGPGSPISPFGFLYLALGAYGALSNEKDKDIQRKEVEQVGNIDLTKSGECKDKNGNTNK